MSIPNHPTTQNQRNSAKRFTQNQLNSAKRVTLSKSTELPSRSVLSALWDRLAQRVRHERLHVSETRCHCASSFSQMPRVKRFFAPRSPYQAASATARTRSSWSRSRHASNVSLPVKVNAGEWPRGYAPYGYKIAKIDGKRTLIPGDP